MSDVDGTVVAIQGREVDDAAPNDGDTYRWDATTSKWVPVAPPQPLEPWVGSVNTQQQVIKRIPWTCRSTGPAPVSTGVVFTLPTDTALTLFIYAVYRKPSSIAGASGRGSNLTIANNGGTLTTIPDVSGFVGNTSGTVPGHPTFLLTASGTTVTLELAYFNMGEGVVMENQGFVDLMLI